MPRRFLATAILLSLATPLFSQAPDPGLAAVPTDAFAFVSVKVSRLWDNPAAKPVRDWVAKQEKNGLLDSLAGVPFAEIERVTLFVPAILGQRDDREPIMLVTTRKPYTDAKVLKALGRGYAGAAEVKLTGRMAQLPEGNRPFRTAILMNDRTLVFTNRTSDEKEANALIELLAKKKAEGILSAALKEAQTHDIVAGVNVIPLEGFVQGIRDRIGEDKGFAPYLVLLKGRTATLTADVGKTVKGQFVMDFPDEETAKLAATAVEDGMTLIAGGLASRFRYAEDEPIEKVVVRWGIRLWKSTQVAVDGRNVVVKGDVPFADDLAKMVAALPKDLKTQVIDVTVSNNIKQLGIAMHNHESAMGHLPSDVYPNAKSLPWSWRVQILPYIEEDNLFKQLDFTKAWDDPVNLKALEKFPMPKLFEHPGRQAPKGYTYFRVFKMPRNAKGTDRPLFVEGQKGASLTTITDGTSNTFMIVEAGEAVPWFKPDVLAYDGKLPLPQLGAKGADEFFVAFCDGSVRKLKPSKLGENKLRALITIQGGEVVQIGDK